PASHVNAVADVVLQRALRAPVVRIVLWTLVLWSAQTALLSCQEVGHWGGDWNDAYGVALEATGLIADGQVPIVPQRRMGLIGWWASPALLIAPSYWAFLLTVLWVHSVAIMPV